MLLLVLQFESLTIEDRSPLLKAEVRSLEFGMVVLFSNDIKSSKEIRKSSTPDIA